MTVQAQTGAPGRAGTPSGDTRATSPTAGRTEHVSTFHQHPLTSLAPTTSRPDTEPDWQVLVLYADDTEKDVKGI